jgi:hypothetical protein
MPLNNWRNRIRDAAKWFFEKAGTAKTQVQQSLSSANNWISNKAKNTWKKFISVKDLTVAYSHRYGAPISSFLLVAGIFAFALRYLNANPENGLLPGDLVEQTLPKNAADTRNANLYYLANIIFVPLQTFLLLIGGLYAWRTLSQNRKFKQHDVESVCIRDYLAIAKQLADAGSDRQKIEVAIRAYWILMVYEYYWWHRGLLSRDLFAVWCEFRVQHFRKNPTYAFATQPSDDPFKFKDYREGYAFCKSEKVFRSPSKFDDLMLALMERANSQAR